MMMDVGEFSGSSSCGFAGNEEVSDVMGTSSSAEIMSGINLSSNACVRDPVLMGQGLDLLLESLAPGVKLGPLMTSKDDNEASSARNDEDCALNETDIVKCEVSARIWDRMVENSAKHRVSFKRVAESQDVEQKFDVMMQKLKYVRLENKSLGFPFADHVPEAIPTRDASECGPTLPPMPTNAAVQPCENSGTKFVCPRTLRADQACDGPAGASDDPLCTEHTCDG